MVERETVRAAKRECERSESKREKKRIEKNEWRENVLQS